MKGDRAWLRGFGRTEVLYDKLRERDRKDLDPTGLTRQTQSPTEVGCAQELQARMSAHLTTSDLKSTNKPWGFVLSCLEVLGVKITIVSLPILKVWSEDTLMKAEVLVTILAGSYIHDGGFNPVQAGISGGSRTRESEFDAALEEVFHKKTSYEGKCGEISERI